MASEKRVVTILLLLLLGANDTTGAEETTGRTFKLPHQIEISVPNDWRLSNEEDLQQYETISKSSLKAKGFPPKTGSAAAWVPFQAQKESGTSAASAMISLIPGEISQEQIENWPETQIQKLVDFLMDAQRKGLIAVGSQNVSIHSAKKIRAGGKMAIHFIMDFTGINNRRYRAEKYFVYTSTRTVIHCNGPRYRPISLVRRQRLSSPL
jgi:hypothetical protein